MHPARVGKYISNLFPATGSNVIPRGAGRGLVERSTFATAADGWKGTGQESRPRRFKVTRTLARTTGFLTELREGAVAHRVKSSHALGKLDVKRRLSVRRVKTDCLHIRNLRFFGDAER